MIVDSAVYRQGARVDCDVDHRDFTLLRKQACQDGDFVWVGLHEPSEEEFADVADAFGLHPLAVEDAIHAHQRPKLERYGDDLLFLVLKTLWYVDEQDAVETGEISLFVGPDYVVSVRHGRELGLTASRDRLEADSDVLAHGPSAVVYVICDVVVDGYLAVIDELQTDVDEVEQSVFSDSRTNDSPRIYTLKREIGEARRAVMPLREPMHKFTVGAVESFHEKTGPYFRDVLDHLTRAAEQIDGLDHLLTSAFEAYTARISVSQNEDMRKISAGVALVAAPTLIAGVYGMNFDHMPELGWTLGYPFALVLMLGTVAGLWVFFKRSGWL